MALTSTTLAVACTASEFRLTLTSVTSLVAAMYLKVNDEVMLVNAVDATAKTVDVERGQRGTLGQAHGILSIAVYGLPSEFAVPDQPHIYTYGASGAISRKPGLHRLAGSGALAMTLSAPTYDEEGNVLLFVATTAQAHTVTLDSGTFHGEALNTKLVFAAAIGNCVEIMVVNGGYVVTLNKNVTLPSTSASSSPSSSPSRSASSSPSVSASTSPS